MATPERKRWWSPVVRAALSSKILERPHLLRMARDDQKIDLTPRNIRILWSRIEAARAESHHVAAQQLAIGRSGGILNEHVEMFASLCSAPGRDAVRDLRKVRLGASSRPEHKPRAYVRKRREAIELELVKEPDMTEILEAISTSSLPGWSIKAAGAAMHHGARIHHIMRYFGVEFTPNNIRIFWSAVRGARLDLQHVHARQIALIQSDGQCMDYAQQLVRWTALETAAAAEAEYHRICRGLRDDGIDPRVLAAECWRTVLVQMARNGLFSPEGQPLTGTEDARARALTSAHVAAYYDTPKSQDQVLSKLLEGRVLQKEKEKQEADAEMDGMLNWLDEDHEYAGKTMPINEPVISRRVVIHAAPATTVTRSGASDEETRVKMRNTLSEKKQIGPVLDRHRIDEIYAELYGEAPWHARIIEWLWRRHLETLDDPERCAWLPPSMIIGPPGCGKTFMLTRLAEILALPAVRMDMTGSLEPWPIAGGAWGWRNAQPGLAVKTILESGYANPFLLLDEVEKAGQSQHGGPLNALLPLLQRETARSYRCPYLEAEIDLSRVSWVMLGNDLAPLSGPLRDRVTVMTARGPEGSEIRTLVERLLGDLVADGQVIDAAIRAMESGKMTLRGLHRLVREFRAIEQRPQLN